jgi:hypothetical protein
VVQAVHGDTLLRAMHQTGNYRAPEGLSEGLGAEAGAEPSGAWPFLFRSKPFSKLFEDVPRRDFRPLLLFVLAVLIRTGASNRDESLRIQLQDAGLQRLSERR